MVGPQFLERSLAGLRLLDAWVDVTAFRDMSTRAHELTGLGEFTAGYQLAREADRLVRGEFTVMAGVANAMARRAERRGPISSR